MTIEIRSPNGSVVTVSGTTNTYGYATISRAVTTRDTYTVTVKTVTKSSYIYDASRNVVTQKDIAII